MSKHTPGPWTYVPSDSYPHLALLKRPYAGPQLFSMEDAQLIAAAPDMAEALRLAFTFLDANYSNADMPDILPACRAALAKAGL